MLQSLIAQPTLIVYIKLLKRLHSVLTYGQCSACDGLGVEVLQKRRMVTTWSDEFNGPANTPIDATKWTHDVGGGGYLGNNQRNTTLISRKCLPRW